MSSVDFLDQLLDGVTIELKALEKITLPTTNIRWRDASRTYRYIDLTSVSIEAKAIIETSEIMQGRAPSRAQKLVEKDDVIFATTRPAQQRYCLIDDQYAGEIASTGYCVLRAKKTEVLPKWILHWIASSSFKTYVEENQSGSAYPAISDAKVKDFEIPIPCPENPKKSLEIQAEIVRILDAFTELTSELITELAARKKQYNFYRDRLLSFPGREVEWMALGEIGEFVRGNGLQKKDFVDVGFPAIHYGQIYTKYGLSANKTFTYVSDTLASSLKKAKKNDLLLATTSENDEDVVKPLAWEGEDAVISGDMMIFKHTQNAKYLAYVFQTTRFQKQKAKYITGAKVRRVSGGDLAKMVIPIPFSGNPEKSLAEQARIVAILDKFDILTKSSSEGLPREIELRQKQYNFYRELLLCFPKQDGVKA